MNRRNYQKELDKILEDLERQGKYLLRQQKKREKKRGR